MLSSVRGHDVQLNQADTITKEVGFFPLLQWKYSPRHLQPCTQRKSEAFRIWKQKSCSPEVANSANCHYLWVRYSQVQGGRLHLESRDWSIPLVTEVLQHFRLEGEPFSNEISNVLCLFLFLFLYKNWGSRDEFVKLGYIWKKMTFLQSFEILEKVAHTLECLLMIALNRRNKLFKVVNKAFLSQPFKNNMHFSTGV